MGKDDLIGLTLGECEILKKLGSGGMGTVYLADHKTLDMLVAVKVLDEELNGDAEFIERFKREAQQTARLDHPNIMRIFGVSESQGLHFMISAYIDGPTLETMLKNKVLTEDKAIFYTLQVLSGLDYAHRDNIIHRDIKPSNIMINRNDEVKITDFGLVRSLDTDVSITKTGVPLGTPAFMSPEQWENKGIDQRADIFSVAVTLYKLLSNKYPFEGNSSIGIYRAIAAGESIPITRWQPDIDSDLDRILQKGMRPNKDTRYQTSYEFGAALKKYLLKTSDTPTKYLSLYPYDILDDKRRETTEYSQLKPQSAETKTQFGTDFDNIAKQDVTPITPPLSPFYDPVVHNRMSSQQEYQVAQSNTPISNLQTPVTPSQTPMLNEIDVRNLESLNKILRFRKFGIIFGLLILFMLLGNMIGSHKTLDERQSELAEVTAFVKAQYGTVEDCDAYLEKYPKGVYIKETAQLKKQKELEETANTKKNDPKRFLKQTRDGWLLEGPLTLDNSVHNFPGKFVISTDGVLKIDAGATIEFDKNSSIFCYGTIKAEGKPGNPVRFKAKNAEDGWNGVAFIGSDCSDSYLESCIFSDGRGMPIHNQAGVVTFIDFDTAKQTRFGGALVIFNKANIQFFNCSFVNNRATTGGGAILCSDARPQFNECSFINNQVELNHDSSKGGAVFVQRESCIEFNKCQFRENKAILGGAIYTVRSYPSIYNSQFENNGVDQSSEYATSGGAIYSDEQCGIRLLDSKFSKNNATKSGGALYSDNSEIMLISNEFSDNAVKNNAKNGQGGAVYYTNKSRFMILTSNFENNECSGQGGAIFMAETAEAFIHLSHFLGNQASIAGAFYIDEATTISMNEVTIMRNEASEKAGGIYRNKGSKFYKENCDISENSPDQILEDE